MSCLNYRLLWTPVIEQPDLYGHWESWILKKWALAHTELFVLTWLSPAAPPVATALVGREFHVLSTVFAFGLVHEEPTLMHHWIQVSSSWITLMTCSYAKSWQCLRSYRPKSVAVFKAIWKVKRGKTTWGAIHPKFPAQFPDNFWYPDAFNAPGYTDNYPDVDASFFIALIKTRGSYFTSAELRSTTSD